MEKSRQLTVTSPYDGRQLATVATLNSTHMEHMLAGAYAMFRAKNQWLSRDARRLTLVRAAHIMETRAEALAQGVAAEGWKHLVDARIEVARAIDGVRMCAEVIHTEAGEVVPLTSPHTHSQYLGFTQKEPVGVVVAVSAFNHPLNLIVHQVAAAFAAGCPVLVKPAEKTPLSCQHFVAILREAGAPEASCQVVIPENIALATRLVTDARVGFFSFIGSAKVGWMLRAQLAPGTRCALEHGGVAPVIVDTTADIEKLVPDVLKGGYYHAGQVCVSVQRVFVHSSQFAAVRARLGAAVAALRVGDPLSEATQVGPLIAPQEVQRVHQWVHDAVADGAQVATGGRVLDRNCYQPTLLLNPRTDSTVSMREIFGPVVCLYTYDDVHTAIAQANSLPFAFQAAVYAQDIDRALHIANALDAAAVMVNEHTAFRQDAMPFAGLRQSGLGVGGIPHTIRDMQIDKMTVLKTTHSTA